VDEIDVKRGISPWFRKAYDTHDVLLVHQVLNKNKMTTSCALCVLRNAT